MSHADRARELYLAFLLGDRPKAEELLSPDFTFTSPYDDRIDRDAYFAHCWPNSTRIRWHEIEQIFEQGDDVAVVYRCVVGGGKQFRNVERLRFERDRIKSVDVFFGATYLDGALVKE